MTAFILTHKKALSLGSAGLLVLNLVLQTFIFPQSANAAAFQEATVRYDRMRTSTATSVRVLIRPATTATESSLQITFPAGFTIGTTPTVNTSGVTNDGATALPGTLTAAGAGQTITISGLTDLTVGTLYAVNIATGVTTPALANAYDVVVTTRTNAPATIDTTTVTTRIIADDQVVVTASVGATFTFALSSNAANIGSLDSGAVSSALPVTATITTNAASGWYLWARSANNGGGGMGALRSNSTSSNIVGGVALGANSAALTVGTPGYGVGVTVTHNAGTGSPTANAAYEGSANKVGTLDATGYRQLSSSNGTATGTGDVTSMVFRASISTSTPPASDYSDTVTIVAAGSF